MPSDPYEDCLLPEDYEQVKDGPARLRDIENSNLELGGKIDDSARDLEKLVENEFFRLGQQVARIEREIRIIGITMAIIVVALLFHLYKG